jgi:hypothetical protein
LTISDNAGNTPSTATVTLSGTGIAPPGGVVSGNISLNSCGGGSLPQTTVTISTSPVLTATTDGNGHFSFPSVPNGTYTVTPSITGPSSVFYPATQTIVVNNGNITTGFSAVLGYSVSGTVSYALSKTGQVYLALNNNSCGGNSTPGTSITKTTLSAGGAFTIRGVAPGTYTLQAWMDNLGYGAQNASNPTGSTASVQVSSANLSGVTVTLTDPGATTLSTAPTLKMVSAIDQGAIVQFKTATNGNGVEAATSYTLEWGTDSTFATFTGSKTFAATGTNGSNLWIVSGLTNGGQPLYFRAQGVAGSSTSNWSTASSGVTIGAPTGGNTVTGTVTFTGTASGPLYVGFYDQNTNNVYATPIANPVSPQQYTVQVPTGSNYFFFGIIDQNNDGIVGPGDISNTDSNSSGSLAITGTATENLTLPSGNSTVTLTTQHWQQGSSSGYNLNFDVRGLSKLPVAVALVSGPNVIIPADMGKCIGCGKDQFNFSVNMNGDRPNAGDAYGLLVTYSGGTSETLPATVGAVLNAFATNLSPTGTGVSTTPTFTWTDPSSPSSYTYQFWLTDSNNNTIWQIPGSNSNSKGFSNTTTSIVWGTDPTGGGSTPTVSSLASSATYSWQIQTQDSNGNEAQTEVSFQTVQAALSLPASGPLGPAATNISYSAQINSSGGSGSGYVFTVNGNQIPTNGTWLTISDGISVSCMGSNTLYIGGVPTLTQIVTLNISVADGAGHTFGPNAYTIAVNPPTPLTLPSAISAALPPGTANESYTSQINAAGGSGSGYVFTVNGTQIPTTGAPVTVSSGDGLTFSNLGGNTLGIGGSPTMATTITLNVSVTDGAGDTANQPYSITVNSPTPLSLPAAGALTSATINQQYSAFINVSGGDHANYTWTVNGTPVPTSNTPVAVSNGITVSNTGGYTLSIGGTPTASGIVTLNVSVLDVGTGETTSAQYTVNVINPAAAYTVSGTVSYGGTKTGWIYLQLMSTNCNGCNSSNLGTAIPVAGAYTIHGVSPGTYTVQAFMDNVGYGAENASNPVGIGASNVTVSSAAVTGANVTLSDPGTVTLSGSPTWDSSQGSGAFSGGAFVSFDSMKNGSGVETPTSYTVEWSGSSTFDSVAGSASFPATGGNKPWIVTGLTNTTTYYFRAAGVAGGTTGDWSAPSGGITIGAPTSGNAVSGTVTFSGKSTGPLYVGFYDQSTGNIYADVVGSHTSPPTSPATYSVQVPTGSNYFFFGVIDQNNVGLVSAPGEISNTNQNNMALVAITSSPMTENLNLTPDSANSQVIVRTQNSQQTNLNGTTNNSYGLDFRVSGLLELPVAVELAKESSPGVSIPVDIGTGAFNGNTNEFDLWPNLNGAIPQAGDSYTLNVTYANGTTQPLTATVGAVLNAYPTGLSPTGTGISTMPSFSWTYPADPGSYLYQFQLQDSNGNTIWTIPPQHSNSNGFPSTIASPISWGIDPTGTGDLPSLPILSGNTTYYWQITTADANDDQATTQVAFQTYGVPLSLPTSDPSTLESTVVNLPYNGSISVTGGSAPYNWSVNGLSDNLYSNTGSDGATLMIGGTPNSIGTVMFQATVYDNTGASFGPETYTIAVNAAGAAGSGWPVSGIVTTNGCGNGQNQPPITISISGAGFTTLTTVADASGNFQFPSIPNGTYTITPSIVGPSSAFYPASQSITVNSSGVSNVSFGATLGYTVSGLAGYNGSKTGQIYLMLNNNQCGGYTTPGTSIAAPGAFTIRGVPPGIYTLQAWMDNLGFGVQNATNPTGSTSNVLVTNANVADVSVGLLNPGTVALSSGPTLLSAIGYSGGAVVNFSDIQNDGVEQAASYTLEWSTSSSFTSIAGSHSFTAVGNNSVWAVNGLGNGSIYYFRAQGVAGSATSNWSNVVGPATIGVPTTGNTVTGTVSFSGTATGPLYVGFFNPNNSFVYATEVGSALNPPKTGATYSINIPSGTYYMFGFIDQNNNNMQDSGDFSYLNPNAVSITSSMSENLTLPSANSTIALTTDHWKNALEYGNSEGYQLNFNVNQGNKLPVAVTLTLASGLNLPVPEDLGLCQNCGNTPFSFNFNFFTVSPTIGDSYGFKVTYSDGTTENKTATVSGVVGALPSSLSPAGTGSNNTQPTFSWNDPANPANGGPYVYQLWVANDNYNTVWQIPGGNSNSRGFPSTITSIAWGTDPTNASNSPSVSSLTDGDVYYWFVTAYDQNGNAGSMEVDYVPDFMALSLPNPNPSTLGPATIGQSYSGSFSASGGYGGYYYSINGSNCWGCNYMPLGNGLVVTNESNTFNVTGTPTATGPVSFQVYVQDATGAQAGPVTYTINVGTYASVSLPAASDNPLGSALTGTSYAAAINASGGPGGGNYAWTVNGVAVSPKMPYVFAGISGGDGLTVATSGGNTLWFAGTPTTAESVSLAVTVTDMTNSNDTATVTYSVPVVAGPNGANNSHLNGTYVCKLNGFYDNNGAPWTALASFQANSTAGTFTNGVFDTNSRKDTTAASGTASGTYSIGSDNNGLLTFNAVLTTGATGSQTTQWAVALTNAASPAQEFRMVEIDDVGSSPSGQHGTADCYQATKTGVFGTDIFAGNSFVFGWNGEDGSGNPKATLGRFYNASGTAAGSLTGGVVDQAGVADSSVTNVALTGGSYTVPDATNGRSTLSFTASGTNGGMATFEAYVIDANRMFIIETDDAKAQSGDVRKQQQATYSGTNLNAPFVLYSQTYEYSNGSVSGYDSSVFQGSGNGSGGLTVNQSYQDENGAYKVGNANGGPIAVTFDSSNLGRATFTPGTDSGYLYFFNNNSAFFLDSNGANGYLETGWMEPQTQTTFTDTTLAGYYMLGQMPVMQETKKGNVGEFHLDNAGNITGGITSAGEGYFTWDQSSPMSYTWDTTAPGTGTFLIGSGEKGASCAVISSTKAACVLNGDSSPSVMILQQ